MAAISFVLWWLVHFFPPGSCKRKWRIVLLMCERFWWRIQRMSQVSMERDQLQQSVSRAESLDREKGQSETQVSHFFAVSLDPRPYSLVRLERRDRTSLSIRRSDWMFGLGQTTAQYRLWWWLLFQDYVVKAVRWTIRLYHRLLFRCRTVNTAWASQVARVDSWDLELDAQGTGFRGLGRRSLSWLATGHSSTWDLRRETLVRIEPLAPVKEKEKRFGCPLGDNQLGTACNIWRAGNGFVAWKKRSSFLIGYWLLVNLSAAWMGWMSSFGNTSFGRRENYFTYQWFPWSFLIFLYQSFFDLHLIFGSPTEL